MACSTRFSPPACSARCGPTPERKQPTCSPRRLARDVVIGSDMTFDKERLIRILIETRAFQLSPTPIFTLASGAKSDMYVDCRVALSFPEARRAIGELMLER